VRLFAPDDEPLPMYETSEVASYEGCAIFRRIGEASNASNNTLRKTQRRFSTT
jgi:hypothetical protein